MKLNLSMNNIHLSDILSSDKHSKKFFRGVYPRDKFCQLPPLILNNNRYAQSHYICNLDESGLPGSHWVVVDFQRNTGKIYYFDPYGLPPIHDDVLTKLTNDCSSLSWNTHQLQAINTTVCGQYCTIYCLLKSRGFSSNDIINKFASNKDNLSSDERDHYIHQWIMNKYPAKLKHFNIGVHDISYFY